MTAMDDRRQQWIRLFEATLTGVADPRLLSGDMYKVDVAAPWFAKNGAAIADAAMAEIDARFPPGPTPVALPKQEV